jgi:cobalt-zinc-cadmium efflux system outer membrane protein
MKFTLLSFTSILVLSANPIHSTNLAAAPLPASDVESLIDYARENNPTLAAAKARADALLQRIAQVRSLDDPELMYGYYVQRMNDRQMLSLTQRFPYPGTLRLRAEMASRTAEQAGFDALASQRMIEEQIRIAYADLALIDATDRLLGENALLVKQIESVIEARIRSGQGTAAESLRNQIERERILDEQATLKTQRTAKVAALNALLGRRISAELPLFDDLAQHLPGEQAVTQGDPQLATYPELMAADQSIQASQAGINLARREGLPGFSVGIEYMDVAGGRRDEWMLTAGIRLPIWRERYRANQREARANVRVAESRWQALRDALAAEWQAASQERNNALRKASLYRDRLIPQAQQVVTSEENAYRANEADLLRVIEARRMLLDLERVFYQAAAQAIRSDATLQRITPPSPQ